MTNRTLHWVTKIGNLEKSLRFFETVFGLRVLRHEEFESGCEATCNGPYGGAWSKTMVGWGPEKTNFVFELTYNYGIDGYAKGDDVQYFAVECPEAAERARCFGYEVTYENGVPVIKGPDEFKYKILPKSQREERWVAVVLKSSSISKTKTYWVDTLGMTEFEPASFVDGATSLTLGWSREQTKLLFIEKPGPVEHKQASGRIANATPDVVPFFDKAKASGLGSIMNPPISLPTPGKADVTVTILADPDGYEICFVGDAAFYDLATPLYDVVDWKLRASRGADGAPPPKHDNVLDTTLTQVDHAGFEALKLKAASTNATLVLDFGASWCKNCKKLKPFLESLAAQNSSKTLFAAVDVDDAPDLAELYQVSAVPHFVFITPTSTTSYVGSDKAALQAALDNALAAPP